MKIEPGTDNAISFDEYLRRARRTEPERAAEVERIARHGLPPLADLDDDDDTQPPTDLDLFGTPT